MRVLLDKPAPTQYNANPKAATDTATFFLDFLMTGAQEEAKPANVGERTEVDLDSLPLESIEENNEESPTSDAVIDTLLMSLLIPEQQEISQGISEQNNLIRKENEQTGFVDLSVGTSAAKVDKQGELNEQKLQATSIQLPDMKQQASVQQPPVQQSDVKLTNNNIQPEIEQSINLPKSVKTSHKADIKSKNDLKGLDNAAVTSEKDISKEQPVIRKETTFNDETAQAPIIQHSQVVMAEVTKPVIRESSTPFSAVDNLQQPMHQQSKIEKIEILLSAGGGKDAHQVQIKITPAELGPVVTKLRIDKNRAELDIMTKNTQASDAIRAHLPMLREQFAQQNIQLNHVHIHESKADLSGNEQFNKQQRHEYVENGKPYENQNTIKKQEVNKESAKDSLVDAYI